VISIDRPINGVIKADQRDAESIWQELDEYVVTKQLTEYFRRFFDAFLAAADNPKDPVLSARMAVWVSGFFGSGKSHFIKILSYLLENIEAVNPKDGTTKRAGAVLRRAQDQGRHAARRCPARGAGQFRRDPVQHRRQGRQQG
jgi:hypothetical protein